MKSVAIGCLVVLPLCGSATATDAATALPSAEATNRPAGERHFLCAYVDNGLAKLMPVTVTESQVSWRLRGSVYFHAKVSESSSLGVFAAEGTEDGGQLFALKFGERSDFVFTEVGAITTQRTYSGECAELP